VKKRAQSKSGEKGRKKRERENDVVVASVGVRGGGREARAHMGVKEREGRHETTQHKKKRESNGRSPSSWSERRGTKKEKSGNDTFVSARPPPLPVEAIRTAVRSGALHEASRRILPAHLVMSNCGNKIADVWIDSDFSNLSGHRRCGYSCATKCRVGCFARIPPRTVNLVSFFHDECEARVPRDVVPLGPLRYVPTSHSLHQPQLLLH
jgi:hypothetical protein